MRPKRRFGLRSGMGSAFLIGATVLCQSAAIRPGFAEAREEGVLRDQLDRLIDHLESVQDPSGDFSTIRANLDRTILEVEEELNSLEEQIREVRSRQSALAGARSNPPSDHWAYRPPALPEIPSTLNADRVRNPIDAFVFNRLDREGLSPSPEAERETLVRRVSLDLTGLPPTPRELDFFLNDPSPEAYERLVDRLLASPHFGEHQSRSWMDLARTADTCGYHIDTKRPMHPYRDWVIAAFNRDLPFDRFTVEQLAGDLLPNPSMDQRIATGFHRNTMFNEEGGIDPEEFRVKAVVDRVGVTGTVWLGTSLACAECHDHKHDPISQREFFEMYALFNTTADLGGGTFATRAPLIHLFEGEQEAEFNRLSERIAGLSNTLNTETPDLAASQRTWEERMRRGLGWVPIDPVEVKSEAGVGLTPLPDGAWTAEGRIRPSTDIYHVSGLWRGESPTALRLEILPAESESGFGLHRGGVPALSEFRLFTAPATGEIEWTAVALRAPTWNIEGQEPRRLLDNNPRSAWVLDATDVPVYEAWFEIPAAAQRMDGRRYRIELEQKAARNSTLAKFRLSATSSEAPVRLPPASIRRILELEPGAPQKGRRPADVKLAVLKTDSPAAPAGRKRSHEQEEELAKYYRSIAPELDGARAELADLEKQKADLLKSVTQALVMGEADEPRETRIHVRGDFLRLGDRVDPGLPRVFGGFPPDLPRNRLGLAEWLVRRDHPLTARVTVNRMWQQIFGRGIVETADDFGLMGSPPTHPELLDWLALEFVQRGWSWKEMLRLIVTSSVYRQSSRVTPDLLEIDPYNRLLARAPRHRLSAEGIRDNALAVAGLLNRKIGGPSVFPWQPPGLWSEIGSPGFGVDDWISDEDEDRFRRGLYTFLRRSNPYPSFIAFDAPTREYCTVKRSITNTPLQALVTLNDPVYLEAAVGFAGRLLREESGGTDQDRIQLAFRCCLSRYPSPDETDKLIGLLERQRTKYSVVTEIEEEAHLHAAEKIGCSRAELAAWTIVCQVLLNLDETLTKG